MSNVLQAASDRLYALVNWFTPRKLMADADMVQGVRMFLISHFFGPFLGHTISLYILYLQRTPDWAWIVFFVAITLFWPLSFLLRLTGSYVPLAFFSIQNLLFIILWGCYHYGGISSPLLPWLITVPLLAFFYLPNARTRIMISLLIGANLIGFFGIYKLQGFPNTIPLDALAGLGFVSTFCAGMYVSMMALYYASMVSSQSDLEQEVQRHRQTAQELSEATELAQQAMRAKSEFLSNMSHELRTPLNAIIGYSEILLEDTPADDQQFSDLQAINGAGQNLLRMINELLDLSKLEAGKMELHREVFSLREFVEQLSRDWEKPMADNGNDFRIEFGDGLGDVVGDSMKLAQAARSLLSNAARYTSGGRVVLSVSNVDGDVTLAVRDTGPGIRPDQVANLFEAFGKQAGETSSIYRETAALGLPLSYRLCQLMGGDLSVESEPGQGSCFTIRVPLLPPVPAAKAVGDESRDPGPAFDHEALVAPLVAR